MTISLPHHCLPENAPRIWSWFQERQGILIWESINLSDPGKTMTTPFLDPHGNVVGKPSWDMANTPALHITDPTQVVVEIPLEVKRFHVAIRRGSQGFSLKLTDASSRRVEREVEKASTKHSCEAWYAFDYSTQECVILIPKSTTLLPEWIRVNCPPPVVDPTLITADPH